MDMIRTKPRVRLAGRCGRDKPIWHAIRPGGATATGSTPQRAYENLLHLTPVRRSA